MSYLKKKYRDELVRQLREQGGYRSDYEVPRVAKVVVNIGVDVGVDSDTLKALAGELAAITGQRPAITKSRRSISNFKLREGVPIGAKVTLRGDRMYDFLERLINVVLPRIRDFRGISDRSFDGRGNYSLGLAEQTIFPELDPDEIKRHQGMDITIVTTARDDEGGRRLLRLMGLPFAGN